MTLLLYIIWILSWADNKIARKSNVWGAKKSLNVKHDIKNTSRNVKLKKIYIKLRAHIFIYYFIEHKDCKIAVDFWSILRNRGAKWFIL